MNLLNVGDPSPILKLLQNPKTRPERFMVVDDGEVSDQLSFPNIWDVTRFDVTEHRFNPIHKIDHKGARAFAEIIYAAYPQGENTLTVRNGKRALTRLALSEKRLDKFPRSKRDDITEAKNAIDDLLLSDVLKRVLCSPLNFSADGVLLARLPRADLGDLDCFILGNLLIQLYPGQVVIPDFGFYGIRSHLSLIRQNRLIVGIRSLDERPDLRSELLRIREKTGSHTTAKDAETLADYSGYARSTGTYRETVNDYIKK